MSLTTRNFTGKIKTKKKQKNLEKNSYLYHKCVIAVTFYFNKHRLAQVICHFLI